MGHLVWNNGMYKELGRNKNGEDSVILRRFLENSWESKKGETTMENEKKKLTSNMYICKKCHRPIPLSEVTKKGVRKRTCQKCIAASSWETRRRKMEERKDSLLYKFPSESEHWLAPVDPEKSGLNPGNCSAYSSEMIEWSCEGCGKPFKKAVHKITRKGNGVYCPSCERKRSEKRKNAKRIQAKGSFARFYPEKAKEWVENLTHSEYGPDDVLTGSGDRIQWECKVCGHRWKTSVVNRTARGSDCPACAGRVVQPGKNDLTTWCLQNNRPDILLSWDSEKNAPATPSQTSRASAKEKWWICYHLCHGESGYSYKMSVSHRTSGRDCPKCGRRYQISYNQMAVYYCIKKYFPDAIYEYSEPQHANRKIDIFIPSYRIGIEYDGNWSHQKIEKDREKDLFCHVHKIHLIRIRENKCPKYESSEVIFINRHTNRADEDLNLSIQDTIAAVYQLAGKEQKVRMEIDIMEKTGDILQLQKELMGNYGRVAEDVPYEKSLQYCAPDIAKLFDAKINGITADRVYRHANIQFAFSHFDEKSQMKHVWRDSPNGMKSASCPICSHRTIQIGYNDLGTTHPELAAQLDRERNAPDVASTVFAGSPDKLFWICPVCGESWDASPNARTSKKVGCPRCARKNKQRAVIRVEDGKEYESVRAAAADNGVKYNTISAAIGKENRTAGGYHWCYKEPEKYAERKKMEVMRVEDGKRFLSPRQAAKEAGVTFSGIYTALKTGGTSGGYHWEWVSKRDGNG